jgi:16S rRNA (cytidine1402-2'-O)-methyltransferase
LVASGLPTDEVYFGGFLPSKQSARRAKLTSVKNTQATLIFYEAPHRLNGALSDAYEILGEREAAIARELTKLHEEIVRGRLSELVQSFSRKGTRGEIVLVIDRNEIVVEGKEPTEKTIRERIAELEGEGLDPRAALKRAAREFGVSRSEAYRRLIAERQITESTTDDGQRTTGD